MFTVYFHEDSGFVLGKKMESGTMEYYNPTTGHYNQIARECWEKNPVTFFRMLNERFGLDEVKMVVAWLW